MANTHLIQFDEAAFDPMKVMPVRHSLSGHPLLQLSKLTALGRRLDRAGAVRATNDQAKPDTNFNEAPVSHRASKPLEDCLQDIERAQAWMALHSIQQDPEYRGFVDEVLDDLQPRVERKDPGMRHRAGFIFVASPRAVTPFHMDHNQNFLLQIAGKKTVYIWEPSDRAVISEKAVELFHAKMSRDLVTFEERHLRSAHKFELEPGMGAYMPTTAPHMVVNGEGASVTFSVCYHSTVAWRQETLHRANYALRKLGLAPKPVGHSVVRDDVVHLASRAYLGVQTGLRKLEGKSTLDRGLRYAPVPSYYY
jgi:Cupin-like domain